jgi:hypothetical protein
MGFRRDGDSKWLCFKCDGRHNQRDFRLQRRRKGNGAASSSSSASSSASSAVSLSKISGV